MEDVYAGLKDKLKDFNFPLVYMFKFIVPSDNHKIALVEAMFNDEADIHTQPSKTGKYISITIKQLMLDVDSVIDVYKEAEKIEGCMSL